VLGKKNKSSSTILCETLELEYLGSVSGMKMNLSTIQAFAPTGKEGTRERAPEASPVPHLLRVEGTEGVCSGV
jgi:hypothetical protein